MIKLIRVDHRLIHGQVAFSWTKFLGINCILVPSDSLIKDDLRINLLRMAKPSSVDKLIIKSIEESADAINRGLTDKYSMMILCESVDDAYELIKRVPSIKELNLGGTKNADDRKQISKSVHLSESDIAKVKELNDSGVECFLQMVPDDSKVNVVGLI